MMVIEIAGMECLWRHISAASVVAAAAFAVEPRRDEGKSS